MAVEYNVSFPRAARELPSPSHHLHQMSGLLKGPELGCGDMDVELTLPPPFVFCLFLGPHLRHMKVPRLGVELKL